MIKNLSITNAIAIITAVVSCVIYVENAKGNLQKQIDYINVRDSTRHADYLQFKNTVQIKK